MRSHVLIEHVEGQISCPFCDLEGTTLNEMNEHVNSQHLLTPTKDSACSLQPQHLQIESDAGTSEGSNTLQSKSSADNTSLATETSTLSPTEITITRIEEKPLESPSPSKKQASKRSRLFLNVPSFSLTAKGNSSQSSTKSHSSDKDSRSSEEGTEQYSCPLCSWKTESPMEITRHVNVVHLDGLSPKASRPAESSNLFECPLCGLTNDSLSAVEEHFNAQHGEEPRSSLVHSEGGSTCSLQCCPVCGMECSDASSLQVHVDGHFSAGHTPGRPQRFASHKTVNPCSASCYYT